MPRITGAGSGLDVEPCSNVAESICSKVCDARRRRSSAGAPTFGASRITRFALFQCVPIASPSSPNAACKRASAPPLAAR